MSLPIASAGHAEIAHEAVSPAARLRTSRKILVVDDNRDAADSLGMLLQFMGADIRTAYDGPSALLACREFLPEIVFLDLVMPGMSGLEVATRLRADPATAGTLLVAMTGWGQDEDRLRSRNSGFDHHLVKPADPAVLEALVNDAGRDTDDAKR